MAFNGCVLCQRVPLKFRQRELTRAIKAMQAAKVEVERIEIAPDGKIIIVPKGGTKQTTGWEDYK